jgi:hypothetical protein
MHEDWMIEADVLPERGRIFCIASAGCTAFALASRGASVAAVDANPAQIGYVRERLNGTAPRAGVVEGMLAGLRRLGPLVGWSHLALSDFCALGDCQAQVEFWRVSTRTAFVPASPSCWILFRSGSPTGRRSLQHCRRGSAASFGAVSNVDSRSIRIARTHTSAFSCSERTGNLTHSLTSL